MAIAQPKASLKGESEHWSSWLKGDGRKAEALALGVGSSHPSYGAGDSAASVFRENLVADEASAV
jgi:hypothetical protein